MSAVPTTSRSSLELMGRLIAATLGVPQQLQASAPVLLLDMVEGMTRLRASPVSSKSSRNALERWRAKATSPWCTRPCRQSGMPAAAHNQRRIGLLQPRQATVTGQAIRRRSAPPGATGRTGKPVDGCGRLRTWGPPAWAVRTVSIPDRYRAVTSCPHE